MSGLHHNASQAALTAIVEELSLAPKEVHNSLYRWLVGLRIDQRLYYVSEEMAREVLWPQLRWDIDLLDLIVRASVTFRLMLEGHESGSCYRDYCEVLGRSIGDVTGRGRGAKGISDAEFHGKMATGAALKELFLQETWLTFVITLERNLARLLPQELLTPIQMGHVESQRTSS